MILTGLFSAIDKFIRFMIIEVFSLIFRIAEVNIFGDTAIETFTKRVYGILGVIILFKIIISAIQYLISPDKLLDKDKGVGGLFQRTIISVALLALVPTIFEFASKIEVYVTKAIPMIFLGEEITSSNDDGDMAREIGTNLAIVTLKPFVIEKASNGGEGTVAEFDTLDEYWEHVGDGCGWFGMDENCKYEYNPFFSIAIGVFLLVVLLSMGIDVATRTIKLGIIQILAPIPISSYINSDKNFKAWYEIAFKVYADLFIRFIVIYFIIYIINELATGGVSINSDGNNIITITSDPFLYIYIIVALLLFAKQAPKFICDILGIESGGMSDIGSMFTRAAGLATAGLGMGTAGTANVANKVKSGFGNVKEQWKKDGVAAGLKAAAKLAGNATASGVAGATSAGFHGTRAAVTGKKVSEVMTAGHKRAVTARQNNELDKLNGIGYGDRMLARAQDFLGLDTSASLAEGRQKAYSTLHQDVGNFKKAVMGRITKTANVAMVEGTGTAVSELGELLARNMNAINSSGNQDLINYANKFNINYDNSTGKWVSTGLKNGEHISYHDLAAINTDAVQSGIGSISSMTGENGALTLQAQKDLFAASMTGSIKDVNGNSIGALNVGSGSTHTDIETAVSTAQQHIAENAVALGSFTDKIEYKDNNGMVITASQDNPVQGANMLINALKTNFGKLDDEIQRRSANVSAEMSHDRNALARASNQRRDSNKKSGS